MRAMAANAKQRRVEQRSPRDAAQLDERLLVDAERRGEPGADVVEFDLAPAELGPGQRRHRRLLEERQHRDDRVVAERPGDRDAAILAEQQDRQGEHLGPIQRGVVGLTGHRGGGQVAERQRPVGGDDHAVEIDAAMDDAGGVQPVDLVARDRRRRARRSRRAAVPRRSRWRSCRRSGARRPGVAATRTPGGDDIGNVGAGALGEQGDQRFVLDELDLAVADRPLGPAVPEAPPHVGQQPGVAGIAAVHLDEQRPVVVVALEQHHSFPLHRRRRQIVDDDPEVAEGEPDPRRGRPPARRTEGEVDDRRRQHPQARSPPIRPRAARRRAGSLRRTAAGSANWPGCGTVG